MLSENTYGTLVRVSAWYDLVVTAPFATPWSVAWLFTVLVQMHTGLGLGGEVPTLSPAAILFANLLGSVVVVWALVRILLPLPVLGRFDAVGRVLFACWQIHAVFHGFSAIVVGFAVMEVTWGILQLLPYRASPTVSRSSARTAPAG